MVLRLLSSFSLALTMPPPPLRASLRNGGADTGLTAAGGRNAAGRDPYKPAVGYPRPARSGTPQPVPGQRPTTRSGVVELVSARRFNPQHRFRRPELFWNLIASSERMLMFFLWCSVVAASSSRFREFQIQDRLTSIWQRLQPEPAGARRIDHIKPQSASSGRGPDADESDDDPLDDAARGASRQAGFFVPRDDGGSYRHHRGQINTMCKHHPARCRYPYAKRRPKKAVVT